MTGEPVNLFAQQEANRRRSRWLVVAFVVFFAWLGFGGDWIYWQLTRAGEAGGYRHVFPWFGLGLSVAAILFAAWATRTGARRVLWSAGATELTSPTTPAERQLVNVVEEMAIAAGLPKPRVHVIADADPNALAAGLDPADSHVAVTQGLLSVCSRDELQAV
ncbi:MAG: M48 family metalloprotease, partial [Gemmatimonadota bacterium]|nr:M48 family metalloprotease [Gemmatimonadota bacterium]